ncbi:50S ribosomal protein L4 [Bacteroidota bacterium]|nr:50S ribosomal protein L4 [Bacteroidota bacterium]
MVLDVYSIKGKKTKKQIKLPKDIFGISTNEHAVYLDVKQYLASQRSGTHKSKERGEVKGSRRKLRKQKGSGAARVGDIKNPIFRGGGRVFGPKPKKYQLKLNKKVKSLAKRSAFSSLYTKSNIIVIEDYKMDKPSTRAYNQILENLGVGNQKTLLATNDNCKNIYLSSRNLKKSDVAQIENVNTYQLININKLIMMESSIKNLTELLK